MKVNKDNENNRLNVSELSLRYISYLIDCIVILGISSLIVVFEKLTPIFLVAFFRYYFVLSPLFPAYSDKILFYSLFFYILVSIIYFFVESVTGKSIGKKICGIKSVKLQDKKEGQHKKTIMDNILSALVKSIPPIQLINGVFAFNGRYSRTILEKHFGETTVRYGKAGVTRHILYGSIGLYFISFTIMLIDIGIFNLSPLNPSPPRSSNFVYSPTLTQLRSIFTGNLSIDLYKYVLGGIVFLFLDVITLMGNSYLSALLIGGSFHSLPSFVLYGVAPHFFIESIGYCFGIATGALIMDFFFSIIQGYFANMDSTYIAKKIVITSIEMLKLFLISVILILLGAFVETYITSFLLKTYYYNSTIILNMKY
ncbi:MAG: RDD family protein [Candidatus Thermoplasmatota archaeon]|jgi:hypothetical protein|nr:RDD family protein [Candidatus Thermoplasmatota archaeon]